MNARTAARALPIALGALCAAALANWMIGGARPPTTDRRVPLPDQSAMVTQPPVDFPGVFKPGDGKAGALKGNWPWFRGQKLDGICAEDVPLVRKWAGSGPTKVWEVTTGEGYAGAAVWEGRVYFLDYDDQSKGDVLRCLSADDGKELWRRGYHIEIGRNHGISRTVAAVSNGCVVTLGPKCHVMCVDANTGDFKWGMDLVRDHGAIVPQWYAGQNPLVDEGKVILGVGGKKDLLMAVDLQTGKIVWETPNTLSWGMTHSSVVPMMFKGKKIYLYAAGKRGPTQGGVVGVSAEDGKIVFAFPDWQIAMANVPTPLPLPDDKILFTGGYGAGGMLVKLEENAGKIAVKVLAKFPPEVMGSEQQTPIFYKGYIYGVLPVTGLLVCMDPDGKTVWSTTGKNRYGAGPYMIADGMILLVNDTGTLSLVEATHEGFKPIAQGRLFEGAHESWGPMALVNGRLFARDMNRLACFDLRKVTP